MSNLVHTEIMNGDFYMQVPENFHPMPEEIAKGKYPAQNRPPVILTNEDATVDYKFGYIDQQIEEELLGELVKEVKVNLKKIYTGIRYFEEDMINAGGKKIGWFDYTSPAIGDTLYNLTFLTFIHGKLMQGTFTCLYAESYEWRSRFLEGIASITEEKNQNE